MNARNLKRSRIAVALAGAGAIIAHATPPSPPAGSPYVTDAQSSYVEDVTSKGIGQVNMITCVMASMAPDQMVNKGDAAGNYIAMVDKNKCDSSGRSDVSNSGASTGSVPEYMTSVVHSTRATNADPMIVKAWIQNSDNGNAVDINVHITATSSPDAANPYGVFRIDYCGLAGGTCNFNGYLDAGASGISYYDVSQNQSGTETTALKLTASSTDTGSGALSMNTGSGTSAFSFAYNSSLYRRSDGSVDECFSRDASDPATRFSVWRYGMYDATTGEHINRNSGFPIEVTSGGTTHQGYLSYWGLWMPDVALANGDTVQKVTYTAGKEPARTSYTVQKAAGKLTRYTKNTRTLDQIDQIAFDVFVSGQDGTLYTGATPAFQAWQQYEMHWDQAAGKLVVTGVMSCGGNGCHTQDISPAAQVDLQFFKASRNGVQGWSQSLGGDVSIDLSAYQAGVTPASAIPVSYRSQSMVYPANFPAHLYCVSNCPDAASMGAYFATQSHNPGDSPYVAGTFNQWQPTATTVTYSADAGNAVYDDGQSQPVVFSNANAMQSDPQYQGGVRSGRLVESLADMACGGNYCESAIGDAAVYYVWETGTNPWNQYVSVVDGQGVPVQFDAPLNLSYTVPSDSAVYGSYAGKSIVLQYNGFGDLNGIPGHCVSHVTNQPASCDQPDSRYVPEFAIPAGAVVSDGTNNYLLKWLEREIRFARKTAGDCAAANLTLPGAMTLPDATGLKNPADPAQADVYIGAKPTVTDAPRVIQGEVQY